MRLRMPVLRQAAEKQQGQDVVYMRWDGNHAQVPGGAVLSQLLARGEYDGSSSAAGGG